MSRCAEGRYSWLPCECSPGPSFPQTEVESARLRALKRRIRRRIAAMQVQRIHRERSKWQAPR